MKNKKFIPRSGGSSQNFFYLVDLEPKEFVYIFEFETENLSLIAMEDLEKDYVEVHTLETDEDPKIICNQMITPDGTVLISHHRHDFVQHVDTLTGETYMNDGGTDYLRRSQNEVPAEDFTIWSTDSFERKRLYARWGTRGKNGDQPLRWIPVASMTNEHLLAVIQTQTHARKDYIDLMKEEYLYRLANGIVLKDD